MLSRLVANSTSPLVKRSFSSLSAVADSSYSRFHTSYLKNLSKFKSTMDNTSASQAEAPNPHKKAYSHPYDNEHYGVNMSPSKASEMMAEFVGPEQVSPHYESFLASRKWAIGFWATSFGLSFMSANVDLHWVARSTIIPFTFWLTMFYWTFEGRKSIFKPLFTRWYRTLAMNDMRGFNSSFHDAFRINIKRNIEGAKEQMDYYLLHEDFLKVKAESINRFLAHEQMNLQKHISDRAINLLKSAKAAEDMNQKAVVNGVVSKVIEAIDAKLEKDMDSISEMIFDSALTGISKGKMTYENDPLMPFVMETLKAEVSKITGLSDEEQVKLVALSSAQLDRLRRMDEDAKNAYLMTAPK